MPTLALSLPIVLNAFVPRIQTPKVLLGSLTSEISITVRRPTSALPIPWQSSGKLRVCIVLLIDGQEYRCEGNVSGGIRLTPGGQEISTYTLTYRPTVLFGQRAKDYVMVAAPDAEGYVRNVPLTRLCELGTSVQGYLVLERLSGSITTVITVGATLERPAPILAKHHNSVAFDAVTEAFEENGDGVISVSHTSSGSDRAVFIGSGVFAGSAGMASVTYGGSGCTELWDVLFDSDSVSSSGHYLAGNPSGSQTVVATADTGSPAEHSVGIVSMTGVDQSTPVGTPVTATGSADPSTVTVAAPASDSLVVDTVVRNGVSATVGANQTERFSTGIGNFLFHYGSTQLGSDGGVMSWSGGACLWGIGAVEFKASAAPGINKGAAVRHYQQLQGA